MHLSFFFFSLSYRSTSAELCPFFIISKKSCQISNLSINTSAPSQTGNKVLTLRLRGDKYQVLTRMLQTSVTNLASPDFGMPLTPSPKGSSSQPTTARSKPQLARCSRGRSTAGLWYTPRPPYVPSSQPAPTVLVPGKVKVVGSGKVSQSGVEVALKQGMGAQKACTSSAPNTHQPGQAVNATLPTGLVWLSHPQEWHFRLESINAPDIQLFISINGKGDALVSL